MSNEHDTTKNILNTIREKKQFRTDKSYLKEDEVDKERIELTPEERREEEKKFRGIVSPRASFDDSFFIYPKSSNIEWSGKLNDLGIEWYFSLDESRGVYITSELLQLRDDTLETLKRLVGYYDTWAKEWSERLAEEYRYEGDDE